MLELKISTFTDESGQDTQGKMFVVCTVCVSSEKAPKLEEVLMEIEKDSGKLAKWFEVGNLRRHKFVKLLVESNILHDLKIYYSLYENKKDYSTLVGSHIAKSVLDFVDGQKYEAKIFIDKTDKGTLSRIGREIKSFHIKYKKIRGLSDNADPFIRLVDAICGMIRDMNKKNNPKSYEALFKKLKKV